SLSLHDALPSWFGGRGASRGGGGNDAGGADPQPPPAGALPGAAHPAPGAGWFPGYAPDPGQPAGADGPECGPGTGGPPYPPWCDGEPGGVEGAPP
ncbi:hypothetical protein ACWEH1_22400, partial [Micromonospora chersina]